VDLTKYYKWAHKYDVYVGTSSASMMWVLTDRELGPRHTLSLPAGERPGGTANWCRVSVFR
jgi:hypothetical protein